MSESRFAFSGKEVVAVSLVLLAGTLILGLSGWLREDPSVSQPSPEPYLVPVNSAGVQELSALPMIGEKTAKRIIQYRTMVGSIESVETLAIASGFSVETVRKSVLPYVSFTTVRPKDHEWQTSTSSPHTSPQVTSPGR